MVFTDWYHAEAVELQESKFFDVLSFKCCKCRRIKSPVCPYSDLKYHMHEGKKTHTRTSKKVHSRVGSDSGTLPKLKEREPASSFFPIEDASRRDGDPLLFPLSSVDLITEPKLEENVEFNDVSGLGPKKLTVRRHVKCGGDGCDSFESKFTHGEIVTHNETSTLSKPTEKTSSPSVEYDSAVHFDSNLLNDSESVNSENIEFEPHTYFSLTELMHPDDTQIEGPGASGNLSKCSENSRAPQGVPECKTVSLADKLEPGSSLQGSGYSCRQCLLKEPAPDLFCEICGLWVHRHCSPSIESPSNLEGWRCINCREWR